MIRFGPRQEAETSTSRSRQRWSRLVPMLALAGVVVLLSGCGSEVVQPYSQIYPQTDKAEDIQTLYKITFWAALIVFVGVQMAILYTALRFRRRNEDRPEQVHGSRKLEIAWTIIPAVILLVLFIPNAQVIFKHAAAEQGPDKFDVDVIGKQWWWEFRYRDIPADPNNPDAGPLVTANEALLPVGADVVFHVTSNNVIHSFWVPQLSGKVDVIPGHDNPLQFVASTPGDYFGECAEFCGAAHAWMRFKVKVVPEENFDAWVGAWRTPPAFDANAETADVMEAPPAFGACLACHNITGTNARIAQQGMAVNSGYLDPQTGEVIRGPGPNLTLLACRDTIAAGVLENTPENLERWLKQTDQVKEGVYMPNYYTMDPGLTDEQVDELVTYLQSLKPADGCPDEDLLVGGEVPAAEVEATDPHPESGEDSQ
jgi:cytochrome c oxidase subunit II